MSQQPPKPHEARRLSKVQILPLGIRWQLEESIECLKQTGFNPNARTGRLNELRWHYSSCSVWHRAYCSCHKFRSGAHCGFQPASKAWFGRQIYFRYLHKVPVCCHSEWCQFAKRTLSTSEYCAGGLQLRPHDGTVWRRSNLLLGRNIRRQKRRASRPRCWRKI